MKPSKKVNKVKQTITKGDVATLPVKDVKALASAGTEQKAAAPTPAPAARPNVIKVLKPDATFRGSTARSAWFARLKEFNGKSEGEFLESTTKNPPALTKNGTPEPPSGWVRFFVRSGVLSLQQP